ncbi:unnamed protein product [Ectocarpus sp. 12 AP-2014]
MDERDVQGPDTLQRRHKYSREIEGARAKPTPPSTPTATPHQLQLNRQPQLQRRLHQRRLRHRRLGCVGRTAAGVDPLFAGQYTAHVLPVQQHGGLPEHGAHARF